MCILGSGIALNSEVCIQHSLIAKAAYFDSGEFGDGLRWELDDEGILKFGGSGEIIDWPWREYEPRIYSQCRIREVIIDKGITKVVGIESRGFVLGGALAEKLGAGLIMARKPGKLPATVIKESFTKEYGVDIVEMHIDSIDENDVVLIHDDLLATGGTALATYKLVKHFHPKNIYMNFIIEITDEGLHGRDKFKGLVDVTTLMVV